MAKSRSRRGRVVLVAMTSAGAVVEEQDVSVENYYDGHCKMIDSGEYRRLSGITVIKGEVYNLNGALDQSFENRYSERGELSGSRTVFADGQVIER